MSGKSAERGQTPEKHGGTEEKQFFKVKTDELTEFERLVYSVLEHYTEKDLVRILQTFMNQPGDEKKLDFALRLVKHNPD